MPVKPKPRKTVAAKQKPKPKKEPQVALSTRKLKQLTKEELERVYNLVLCNDMGTLRKLAQSEKISALEAMVINVIIKVAEKGDIGTFETLLKRLIGSAEENPLNPGGIMGDARNVKVVVTIPSNGREAKIVAS